MKPPAWLVEFHRQWMSARGRRVDHAVRAFRRDWEQLLDDAGVRSAEDRQAAGREAEKLPQLKLHRRKGRAYLIEAIELPVGSEAWLHSLFGSETAAELQQRSRAIVNGWSSRKHPLLPELWSELSQRLGDAIAATRILGPFPWRDPDRLDALLTLVFQLTGREWAEGTLIRDASTALGYESKWLEAQETVAVRALHLLFGRETPLERIGIQSSNSVLHFSGPLTLHFADGTQHVTEALRFESSLPIAELDRSASITTTAERLLTVENRKTTFLQLARADATRTTLIVATSFPSEAVRRLLEKLPLELPHYHFGDTDPAGWDILRQLRSLSPRPVMPYLMNWRPGDTSRALTVREHQLLARLVEDPRMADCLSQLETMRAAGKCGLFEQESLGAPDLRSWPFYSIPS